MTGNKAYLAEYQDFNGGPVAFGLIDKKNKVLFTDTKCLVLSPEFKLPDDNQVLLRIPRQNNMYNFNLENIVPSGGLACLITKATIDESNKWHRRLGHVNFKNLNKLVKGNLVRSLPSKIFQNDHTCVACQKGKQHKASCKAKSVSSISQPLQLLHMDLFGPTSVRTLNHKTYCLVITDDFSRFSWAFFLRTKDETSGILKVNTIRCDNRTKFKNMDFIEFCGSKGIKREYSTEDNIDAGNSKIEAESAQDYFVLPIWSSYTSTIKSSKQNNGKQDANDAAEALRKKLTKDNLDFSLQAGAAKASSTNTVNTASTPVSTDSPCGGLSFTDTDQDDYEIPALEDMYDHPTDGILPMHLMMMRVQWLTS
ncbi:putative ribonuclease H-like domain-containing protein [Tanacetum coccineum]